MKIMILPLKELKDFLFFGGMGGILTGLLCVGTSEIWGDIDGPAFCRQTLGFWERSGTGFGIRDSKGNFKTLSHCNLILFWPLQRSPVGLFF